MIWYRHSRSRGRFSGVEESPQCLLFSRCRSRLWTPGEGAVKAEQKPFALIPADPLHPTHTRGGCDYRLGIPDPSVSCRLRPVSGLTAAVTGYEAGPLTELKAVTS